MSQPSPDAKAVVRAAEALTTQVRRIADTLETPVVEYEVREETTPLPSINAADVQGFCPACGHGVLMLGDGGHVVCTLIDCPDPDAVDKLLTRTDDGPTTPATTCSAQYTGHASGARDCIRAAQHHGDHIDEQGYHWSDTVAVYPIDSTVRVAHWHPVAEQLAGERQELAGMVGEFIDAQMRMARPADEGDDAVAPTCWHTEPGSPCDWDRCHQPERLAAGDKGVDPATTPPLGPKLRAADEEGAPNMLRVLVDRSARGILNPGEGDALRRRVEQLIAGRETWKTKAEEIERDRDQHAAVLTDALGRFTHNGAGGYQCLLSVPSHVFEGWQAVVAPTVERPWWEQVREAQAAIERVRNYLAELEGAGWSQSAIARRIRAALDGTEQPTTEPDFTDQHTNPGIIGTTEGP